MQSAGSRGHRIGGGSRVEIVEWIPAGLSPVDAARAGIVARVHRGEGGRRRALAEAAALSAVDHPHIATMLGVDDEGGSVAILVPRLSADDARDWLRARGRLPAGEAVTLLVPLLRALLHLERRGLDGSVDLASLFALDDVLFDGRGAPVISTLRLAPPSGAALLRRPVGGAAGVAVRLVREVTAALDPSDDAGGRARRSALDDVLIRSEPPTIDELIETVFEVASPAPLTRIGPEPPRTVTAVDDPVLSESVRDRAVALGRRIRGALAEVRPKVWVTAGVVGISAVGALVLGSPGGSGTTPTASGSPSPDTNAMSSAAPTLPVPTPDTPTPARSAADDEESALADTPDRAFPVLLRLRADCLRALDEDCVRGVDEPGSPALDADLAAIGDPGLLQRLPVDLEPEGVVNRLGGAVLFGATVRPKGEPASVLVTRTEAGWRLRSVLTDAPGQEG